MFKKSRVYIKIKSHPSPLSRFLAPSAAELAKILASEGSPFSCLKFKYTPLDRGHIEALKSLFSPRSKVTNMEFLNTMMGDEAGAALFRLIREQLPGRLAHLALPGNNLFVAPPAHGLGTPSTTPVLAPSLVVRSLGERPAGAVIQRAGLVSLVLSHNPLGDGGFQHLVDVVPQCPHLAKIGLAETALTGASGHALGRLVDGLPRLSQLDVSQNALGDPGLLPLFARLVRKLPAITGARSESLSPLMGLPVVLASEPDPDPDPELDSESPPLVDACEPSVPISLLGPAPATPGSSGTLNASASSGVLGLPPPFAAQPPLQAQPPPRHLPMDGAPRLNPLGLGGGFRVVVPPLTPGSSSTPPNGGGPPPGWGTVGALRPAPPLAPLTPSGPMAMALTAPLRPPPMAGRGPIRPHPQGLEVLNLRQTAMSGAGAHSLISALKVCTSLRALDLSENPLDKASARELCSCIVGHPSLRDVVAKGLPNGALSQLVGLAVDMKDRAAREAREAKKAARKAKPPKVGQPDGPKGPPAGGPPTQRGAAGAKPKGPPRPPLKCVRCLVYDEVGAFSRLKYATTGNLCWTGALSVLFSLGLHVYSAVMRTLLLKGYYEASAATGSTFYFFGFIVAFWALACIVSGVAFLRIFKGHKKIGLLRKGLHFTPLGLVVEGLGVLGAHRGGWEGMTRVHENPWSKATMQTLTLVLTLLESLPQSFLQAATLIIPQPSFRPVCTSPALPCPVHAPMSYALALVHCPSCTLPCTLPLYTALYTAPVHCPCTLSPTRHGWRVGQYPELDWIAVASFAGSLASMAWGFASFFAQAVRPTHDPLQATLVSADLLKGTLYFLTAIGTSLFRFALGATYYGWVVFLVVALEAFLWFLFYMGAVSNLGGPGTLMPRVFTLTALSFGSFSARDTALKALRGGGGASSDLLQTTVRGRVLLAPWMRRVPRVAFLAMDLFILGIRGIRLRWPASLSPFGLQSHAHCGGQVSGYMLWLHFFSAARVEPLVPTHLAYAVLAVYGAEVAWQLLVRPCFERNGLSRRIAPAIVAQAAGPTEDEVRHHAPARLLATPPGRLEKEPHPPPCRAPLLRRGGGAQLREKGDEDLIALEEMAPLSFGAAPGRPPVGMVMGPGAPPGAVVGMPGFPPVPGGRFLVRPPGMPGAIPTAVETGALGMLGYGMGTGTGTGSMGMAMAMGAMTMGRGMGSWMGFPVAPQQPQPGLGWGLGYGGTPGWGPGIGGLLPGVPLFGVPHVPLEMAPATALHSVRTIPGAIHTVSAQDPSPANSAAPPVPISRPDVTHDSMDLPTITA
ncbi:hypothetical protein PAPYR_7465 [Paratrimastix pyriformis]|uniref:Uncharacterized protein n=1 Tax=Paratrimastix pyriformis TaxID=342808 RepID=A0ABQ8UCZ8_9EUKA|nr:hypothetical protein PAPYR_7465 [Paratrimastix pyriformis]